MNNININNSLSVKHEISILDKDNNVVYESGPIKNMITDYGLNTIQNQTLASMFTYMHYGTDNTANARIYLGDWTITGGTSITLNTTFFEEDDTLGYGREIVFPNGDISRISTYTSVTEATLSSAVTDGSFSGSFTVWNVEVSDLYTEIGTTNSYVQLAGSNGYSRPALDQRELYRTFISDVITDGATIGEIGLSKTGTSLFARLALETPIVVPEGGRITNKVTLYYSTGGADTIHDCTITGIGACTFKYGERNVDSLYAMNGISSTGEELTIDSNRNSFNIGFHSSGAYAGANMSGYLSLSSAFTSSKPTLFNKGTTTFPSYVSGDFGLSMTSVWDMIDFSELTANSVYFVWDDISGRNAGYIHILFPSQQTFAINQRLTITVTKTWGRAY